MFAGLHTDPPGPPSARGLARYVPARLAAGSLSSKPKPQRDRTLPGTAPAASPRYKRREPETAGKADLHTAARRPGPTAGQQQARFRSRQGEIQRGRAVTEPTVQSSFVLSCSSTPARGSGAARFLISHPRSVLHEPASSHRAATSCSYQGALRTSSEKTHTSVSHLAPNPQSCSRQTSGLQALCAAAPGRQPFSAVSIPASLARPQL